MHKMFSQPIMSDLSPSLEWNVLYFNHYMDTNSFKINENLKTRVYGLIIVIARRAENMHIVFILPALGRFVLYN